MTPEVGDRVEFDAGDGPSEGVVTFVAPDGIVVRDDDGFLSVVSAATVVG